MIDTEYYDKENDDYDYKALVDECYGSVLVYDDDGKVVDEVCNHFYDDRGRCVFCDDLQYKSLSYCELCCCDPD